MAAKSWEERRKVPVVYYLCKNGQLQHPHFMEVSLSSPEGLFLRDVIRRLNSLRGNGMAAMYAWSSKRSYRNGFVWQDLSENDIIVPAHGTEYILKGSELVQGSSEKTLDFSDSTQIPLLRRSKPWQSFDLTESRTEINEKAADASTQTHERRNWRRSRSEVPMELQRDEISPPPSSSGSESMLIRPDGQDSKGRNRASDLLMHLISCGSFSIKEEGFAMVSHYRSRLPRPRGVTNFHDHSRLSIADRERFSGNLIEIKMRKKKGEEPPLLIRSSSFDSERVLNLDMDEEVDDDHTGGKYGSQRAVKLTRKEVAGNRGSISDRRRFSS